MFAPPRSLIPNNGETLKTLFEVKLQKAETVDIPPTSTVAAEATNAQLAEAVAKVMTHVAEDAAPAAKDAAPAAEDVAPAAEVDVVAVDDASVVSNGADVKVPEADVNDDIEDDTVGAEDADVGGPEDAVEFNPVSGEQAKEATTALAVDGRAQSITKNEELEIDVQVPVQESILDESVSTLAEKHTVRQLKDMCKKHGLQTVGKKIELATRILEHESGDSQDIVVIQQ